MHGKAQEAVTGLGSYLLADRIGQGGMATVYKARRRGGDLQRTVVVKRMLPEYAHKPELVEMFRTEARLLALLNHSNIVQFLEFGLVDGVPYMVMEYLDGHDVAQLLNQVGRQRQRLPIEATVTIAREMCQGLGWAHEFVAPGGVRHQIIHRDVSPANVMVCRDGAVKLLDFGIAKITREFSRDVTALKGKCGYMAPEQVRNQPIDRRVDVFSAGVVLHEMLTGKRLFRGTTWLETLREISTARVQPPSALNPEVPPELDAIVMRALALDPEARYGSAAEMCDALEELPVRGYSRKRLAQLLASQFPDEDAVAPFPTEHTLVDLDESEVEVIHSVGPMAALSAEDADMPREHTRAERSRRRPPRSRALTIAISALGGAAVAALLSIALVRPQPSPIVQPLTRVQQAPVPAAPTQPIAVAAPQAAAPGLAVAPVAAVETPTAVKSTVAVTVASATPPSNERPRGHAGMLFATPPQRAHVTARSVSASSEEAVTVPAVVAMSSAEPFAPEATPPEGADDPLGELDRVLANEAPQTP